MTKRRDPEAILAAYLADGMEVLSDRVVDAILDETHRTRQRAVFGPWRTRPMSKIALGAAAAIAVVAIGGGVWIGAFGPTGGVGGPTQSPSPSASPDAVASPSLTPSASPRLPDFPFTRQTLTAGAYHTTAFSQVMTVTMPDLADEIGSDQRIEGFIYGNRHTVQIGFEPVNAAVTIHDDFRINSHLCRPTIEVQEVPESPDAVGAWLHGMVAAFGPTMTVTDLPDVMVDGRLTKVYDVVTDPTCGEDQPPGSADIWFGSSQLHRIYAIPTGTDTILAITWNQGGNLEPSKLYSIADRLVKSMTFD